MRIFSPQKWKHVLTSARQDARKLGTVGAMKMGVGWISTILAKDAGFRPSKMMMTLHPSSLQFPISFRAGSSDLYVIRQVLVEEEYSSLRDLNGVELIVDCGANIGCSSAYFLSAFPEAHVVAVEPDGANFEVLEANLAPYGPRARAIRAAVWPLDDEELQSSRGTYRDGLDWAVTVGKADGAGGSGSVAGVTLDKILGESRRQHIDLLKIDIEGSEEEVFNGAVAPWLDRTRNLCIELHGTTCSESFERAMRPYSFNEAVEGELTIRRDISRTGRVAE